MTGYGWVRVQKQVVKDYDPHGGHGRACVGDRVHVGVSHGMVGSKYCDLGGCLLCLSLCRRAFQDLLKVGPSSLLMLCGCLLLHIPIHCLISYHDSLHFVLTFQAPVY